MILPTTEIASIPASRKLRILPQIVLLPMRIMIISSWYQPPAFSAVLNTMHTMETADFAKSTAKPNGTEKRLTAP